MIIFQINASKITFCFWFTTLRKPSPWHNFDWRKHSLVNSACTRVTWSRKIDQRTRNRLNRLGPLSHFGETKLEKRRLLALESQSVCWTRVALPSERTLSRTFLERDFKGTLYSSNGCSINSWPPLIKTLTSVRKYHDKMTLPLWSPSNTARILARYDFPRPQFPLQLSCII